MITCIARLAPKAVLAATALVFASGAQAAHSYAPFTFALSTGAHDHGLWVADTDNLGNPPLQLTNQDLDGLPGTNVAILDSWTYDSVRHEATSVQPALIVYGVGGRLFREDLVTIGPVQGFSNGTYKELCSLTALDASSYSSTTSYVQAKVEPVGSPNTCTSGLGIVTWLIPANATPTTGPTLEPTNWAVLAALTDSNTGTFANWIVWTGSGFSAFSANFSTGVVLLQGLPAGLPPLQVGRLSGTAYFLSSAVSGATKTDTLYRVSMSGSGVTGSFSYPTTAPCAAQWVGSAIDASTGLFIFGEPTSSGYTVYTTPIAGGGTNLIYSDSSGNQCGSIGGDGPSVGYVALNETDMAATTQHVISVKETGLANQKAILLAPGSANVTASVSYTINGHNWIETWDFSGSVPVSKELVIDGDGRWVNYYTNSFASYDMWAGFFTGSSVAADRKIIYLFSPIGAGESCIGGVGGTLTAIDPVTFASTTVSNLPADTCSVEAYGWSPAVVGGVREPAGSSAIEVDWVSSKMHVLLGPQTGGTFTNLSTLSGYPFF